MKRRSPTPGASIEIRRRELAFRELVPRLENLGRNVARRLTSRYRAFLLAGEAMPDWRLLQGFVLRRLRKRMEELLAAEDRHRRALLRCRGTRLRRDRAAGAVAPILRRLREEIETLSGPGQELLGPRPENASPPELWRLGRLVLSALGRPDLLWSAAHPAAESTAEEALDTLERALADLGTALEQVESLRRLAARSRRARRRALLRFDRELGRCARFHQALYTAADMDFDAEQARAPL